MLKNSPKKILITGLPFSGKTYLSEFFKIKGVNSIDTDEIRGLGNWFDKNGNQVVFPEKADSVWLENNDFLWDKDFLSSWLEKQKSDIYIFGLAANVLQTIHLFNKVFYLDLSVDILKERFANNKRANPMGQTEEQQLNILEELARFSKKARDNGLIFIQADQTPEEIYSLIINYK